MGHAVDGRLLADGICPGRVNGFNRIYYSPDLSVLPAFLCGCGGLPFSGPPNLPAPAAAAAAAATAARVLQGPSAGITTMLPLLNRLWLSAGLGRWYGIGKGLAFNLIKRKKKNEWELQSHHVSRTGRVPGTVPFDDSHFSVPFQRDLILHLYEFVIVCETEIQEF